MTEPKEPTPLEHALKTIEMQEREIDKLEQRASYISENLAKLQLRINEKQQVVIDKAVALTLANQSHSIGDVRSVVRYQLFTSLVILAVLVYLTLR